MRSFTLTAALTLALVGASARSASAAPPGEPAAAPEPTPGVDVAPTPDLREQAFAQHALRMESGHVMRGGYEVYPTTLFLLTGRPDLNEALRARGTTKTVLIAVGAVAAIAGVIWWTSSLLRRTCTDTDYPPGCSNGSNPNPYSMMVAAGGGAILITGLLLSPDPVSDREKEELVRNYNAQLRERMGLLGALDAARRTARVSAAAAPDGRSGLLLAGCSF